MVEAEDSQLSGCGYKPLRGILDGVSEASYYIGKKRNIVSQMGHTKKNILKYIKIEKKIDTLTNKQMDKLTN